MVEAAKTPAAEQDEKQLIAEIAREQIAALAPQELPLFRRTSERYFERPQDLERRGGSGDVLGFGVGGAATFITPIVLAVITEAVTFLAAELKKQLQAESSTAIASLVKRLFKRFESTPAPSATGKPAPSTERVAAVGLSQQQIERLRALVVERAQALGLAAPQSELLADSLAGGLVRAA